MFCYSWVKCA